MELAMGSGAPLHFFRVYILIVNFDVNNLALEADDQLTVVGPPGELPDADELASVLLSD